MMNNFAYGSIYVYQVVGVVHTHRRSSQFPQTPENNSDFFKKLKM